MRRDEVLLDDVKIDAILGWAVNTRNAEMSKGDDRDCAKIGLACDLQDACLAYINRVGTERQVERLTEEVSRLKKELRATNALLDVLRTRQEAIPAAHGPTVTSL